MRKASIACFVLALACAAFAYWGLRTVAGRRAFDEMAGMVPLGAGVVGAILAFCAVVTWWLSRHSAK
jgi:uncharacterized membrane protein